MRVRVGEARTSTASQHGLSRFRGIISGRSASVRRSSARVTGVYDSCNIGQENIGIQFRFSLIFRLDMAYLVTTNFNFLLR